MHCRKSHSPPQQSYQPRNSHLWKYSLKLLQLLAGQKLSWSECLITTVIKSLMNMYLHIHTGTRILQWWIYCGKFEKKEKICNSNLRNLKTLPVESFETCKKVCSNEKSKERNACSAPSDTHIHLLWHIFISTFFKWCCVIQFCMSVMPERCGGEFISLIRQGSCSPG